MRRLREGWKDVLCHGGWAAAGLRTGGSYRGRAGAVGWALVVSRIEDGLLDTQHGGKAAPATRYPVCSISQPGE